MTDIHRRLIGLLSVAAVLTCALGTGNLALAQEPVTDAPADAEGDTDTADATSLPPDYAGQDGLPSELLIDANRLAEETKLLETLKAYNVINKPPSGFFTKIGQWFKNLTSGKKSPTKLTVSAVAQNSSSIGQRLIAVEGLWIEENGTNYITEGTARIELAQGATTVIQGFEGPSPHGQPALVSGTIFVQAQGPVLNMSEARPAPVLTNVRLGRCYELADTVADYQKAHDTYTEAASSSEAGSLSWGGFAMTQGAQLAEHQLRDEKAASKLYQRAWELEGRTVAGKTGDKQPPTTWSRTNQGDWQLQTLRQAVAGPLDAISKKGFWYKFVDFFVVICGGNAGLGLILMAIVTRGLLYPLTRKQIKSQKAMQKLQPQIKALQEKHGSDKQKFQEDFWKLCRANKVNPLGGCLPLLVQMPLLIMVYRGIRAYVVQLADHSFLWIPSLADPNIILLVLYTISMVAFQKLTMKSQPTMDPQQQQQQNMMVWMMPVMFFIFFQTMASGFILYWLGTNLIYLPQQYFGTRARKNEDDADGGEKTVTLDAKGGDDDGPAWVNRLKGMAGGKKEEDDAGNGPLSYEKKKQHEKRSQRPPSRRRRRR